MLQSIGVGIAAVLMVIFAASAFMANLDPNRRRFDLDTRNPAGREGSPGSASSVNDGGWRRRPKDSVQPSRRVVPDGTTCTCDAFALYGECMHSRYAERVQ